MIPDWSSSGILPPVRNNPTGLDRSPYKSDLLEFSTRFNTSPERTTLLLGLLDYRRALRTAGLNSGFQWLDGSFVEDVESLNNRPPSDIDVVTFCNLPQGMTQIDLVKSHPELFNNGLVKSTYKVDSYFVFLGSKLDKPIINKVSYWHSLWSHNRNNLWKGFVEVDLDLTKGEDLDAGQHLRQPIA
jgi:hypothetical protein